MSLLSPDEEEKKLPLENDYIYQFGRNMPGMPEWMPEVAFTVRVFHNPEDEQLYFHICNESTNLCFIRVRFSRGGGEYVRVLLPKEMRQIGGDELEDIVAFNLKGLLNHVKSINVIVFDDTYYVGIDRSIRPDLHTLVLSDMLSERQHMSFKLKRKGGRLKYDGYGNPKIRTDTDVPETDKGATIIIPT